MARKLGKVDEIRVDAGQLIKEVLRSDGYINISKALSFAVGIDAAVVYSELLSRRAYFKDRGSVVGGYFYNTVEDLNEGTSLTDYQQRKAIKVLVGSGLLEVVVRGVPPRRYFRINEDTEGLLVIIEEGVRKQKILESKRQMKEWEV